jgi:curved DNA-binding protein CbpA
MVQVNEAWAILSNPQTRARYDEARRSSSALSVRQVAAADAQAARHKAEHYPTKWSDFDNWLSAVSGDFTSARYGKVDAGMTAWPTAVNSVSGQLFLWGGGIFGVLILLILLLSDGVPPKIDLGRMILAFGLAACGGAWLGYWVHRFLGDRMRPPIRRKWHTTLQVQFPEAGSDTIVVRCPRCDQALRLPKAGQPLAVTCPKCRNSFDLPPSFV